MLQAGLSCGTGSFDAAHGEGGPTGDSPRHGHHHACEQVSLSPYVMLEPCHAAPLNRPFTPPDFVNVTRIRAVTRTC